MSSVVPTSGTGAAYAPWRRSPVRREFRQRYPYRKLERRVKIWIPIVVFLVVLVLPFYLDKAIAAVAGAIALTWLGRKPGVALKVLIVVLPFSLLTLSWLWKIGLPVQFVRPIAFWKEAMIAAVVVGGILKARTAGIKPDLLDMFCLGYITLGVSYLMMPGFFVDGPGAAVAFGTRLNGFRIDVIYMVLFLAARHARIPAAQVMKAARAFAMMCGAVGLLSVYEFFFASSWNTFVTRTVGLPSYKYFILNIRPQSDPYFYDIRVYTSVAGREVLRVGGILVNTQAFAFMLLVGVAIMAETQVRRRSGRGGWIALAFPLAIGGAILTQTRSALMALAIILALAVLRQPGRLLIHRIRLTLVAGALALLAIPIVFSTGLSDRIAGKDDLSSNEGHREQTSSGIDLMLDVPLGTGLATAAGAAQRAAIEGGPVTEYHVSENQFLQIGTQLGIIGLFLWVGIYLTALQKMGAVLRRAHGQRGSRRYGSYGDSRTYDDEDAAASKHPAAVIVSATRTCLVGLLPTMIFLQSFIFFEVSWSVWGLAGAALGCLEVAGTKNDPDAEPDAYASGEAPAAAYA